MRKRAIIETGDDQFSNKVLDQILKDYEKPEDSLSENRLLQQLTKALVERTLSGE